MASRSAAGSEEDVGELFSDCFWEIKGFKQVVQRIDDGARLTDGLMQCIGERAELEMKYAKGLKTWAKKWEDATIKGPEYGSMVHTMKSLSREAEETADIHYEVRQKIVGSVIESVKHWKNGQYQKTFVKWRQTVAANEGFEKAQRPWSKRYIKVDKTKKAYHNAARQREQLKRQLELYEQDPMTTSDSVKKLKDKLNKSISEADKGKEKYQDRLNDLNMSNQQYINEMSVEFEKCQALEKERITFFKKTLEDYARYLDVSKNSSLANSFANVTQALDEVSVEEDLKKYADSKGTGMGMNWPKFVEFDETETYPPIGNLQFKEPESGGDNHYSVYDDKKSEPESKASNPFNGFDDEGSEWGDTNYNANVPTSEVKVMAMFDYMGAEADELSFKEGEVIIQLDEEDENGWCRGILNGVEGLYPGSYVQRIK